MEYRIATRPTAVGSISPMAQVYAWMAVGLALTGAVAALTVRSQSALDFIYGNGLVFAALVVLELAGVVILSSSITGLSSGTAAALFLSYSVLNGLTISGIFLYYTDASIASTFFVTAGTFAVMSFYGATTKRDLASIGAIGFMTLVGLVLATVVNLFLQNETTYWVLTYLGVIVFIGLTAADTQQVQARMARSSEAGQGNVAIIGALSLYLDFMNLFLDLLRLFGRGRSRD